MNKKWRIGFLSLLSIGSAVAATTATIAWFDTRLNVGVDNRINGHSNGAYFAGGDGTSDHPFIINTPRHLYNLAWLQYLGYFNPNSIGLHIGPAGGPVYFELDNNLSEPINMDVLTLPPIGTEQFPFIGYFNGNGKTIRNLKVDNYVDKEDPDHIDKTPSVIKEAQALFDGGTQDNVLKESIGGTVYSSTKAVNTMGMFGVTDTKNDNDDTNHIYDFTLDSPTISSSSSNLLVGAIVGYSDSKISNVAVISPTFDINNTPSALDTVNITGNYSDYTLVGYTPAKYLKNKTEKTTDAKTPVVSYEKTSGISGSEYGASIPMENIYTKLQNLYNNVAEPVKYHAIWDGVIGEGTLTKDPIYDTNGRVTFALYGTEEKDSSNATIAQYTFAKRQDTDDYIYLYGEDSGSYTQNIEGISYETAINEGAMFKISDGDGHWIRSNYTQNGTSGTFDVVVESNPDNATEWKFENGKIHSYTATRTQAGVSYYAYLMRKADGGLEVEIKAETDASAVGTAATTWVFGGDSETVYEEIEDEEGGISVFEKTYTYRVLKTSVGEKSTAYIKYDSTDGWKTILFSEDYSVFKIGNQYLSIDSVSPNVRVSLTNNFDSATKWYVSEKGGYKFYFDDVAYVFATKIPTFTQDGTCSTGGYYSAVSSNQLVLVEEENSGYVTYPANERYTYDVGYYNYTLVELNGNNYYGTTFSLTLKSGNNTKDQKYTFLAKVNGNELQYVTAANSATAVELKGPEIDIRPYNLTFQTGSRTEVVNWESTPTYFPLSYAPNGTDVYEKNTGYIVAGSSYKASNTFYGDIRVSDYANNSSNNRLSNSLNGSSTYNNLTILTHEKGKNGSTGSWVAVKDSFNSLDNVPNTLTSVTSTFKTPEQLELVRYNDSRAELDTAFRANFSHIYGLHFMDATISSTNKITIPKAQILGTTHTNYEMPRDCIDFNLDKHGFITFYAGTYFPDNNTFFSLHEITRNADHSISNIKEISKIYENVGEGRKDKRYIYYYSDGTTNLNNSVDSIENVNYPLFDMSWVTSPSWKDNAVYYFEIPVIQGEYALGSVANKNGAYLMYLDIGTARKNLETTVIEEDYVTNNAISTYVDGVDFVDSSFSGTVTGGASANIAVPTSNSDTVSFSLSGSTLTCSGNNLTASHIGEGITVTGATDNRADGDEVRVQKTTTIAYDDFEETITKTVVTKTTTNGGTPVTTSDTPIVTPNVTSYDVSIIEQETDSELVSFSYWNDVGFTTDVDCENNVYTITFATTEAFEIYVNSYTPGEGEHPYTVVFKLSNGTTLKTLSNSNP